MDGLSGAGLGSLGLVWQHDSCSQLTLKIFRNPWQFERFRNFSIFFEIFRNFSKLIEIFRNFSKFLT